MEIHIFRLTYVFFPGRFVFTCAHLRMGKSNGKQIGWTKDIETW